jgi:two-component system OmpR family response regulator
MSMTKILIVEDDRNLLDTLAYNLKKEGYEVIKSMSGTEAVQVAKHDAPDIIVLDVMLPGINGFEVCRAIRKDMIVPILMLTAKKKSIRKGILSGWMVTTWN